MFRIEPPQQGNERTFALGILFEVGLGFVGIVLARWLEIPLFSRLEFNFDAIFRGVVAAIPMLILMGLVTVSTWAPLVQLRKHVESLVREMFAQSHWTAIALVSIAAGIGEEVLFRGALQPWIESYSSPWIAIVIASVLFGLAHAMSFTYFAAATLIGFYLGWLAHEFNDLVAPIVAHALYDFIALLYVSMRVKRKL